MSYTVTAAVYCSFNYLSYKYCQPVWCLVDRPYLFNFISFTNSPSQ